MARNFTFAVFRTGKHTDSAGNEREWTEQDLDEIVRLYNEQKEHEAPIVIGHPKTNAPAFGWIERLFRTGETLFADAKDVAEEFVDWIGRGLYKKRSIALYPDHTLRHVGFLGAAAPAVKGLPDWAFSQGTEPMSYEFEDRVEFSDAWKWDNLRRLFQGMREFLIELKGIETADKFLSSWIIDTIKPPADPLGDTNDYSDPHPLKEPFMKDKETPGDPASAARIAALEAENAKLAAAARAAEFSAFLDSEEIKTRVSPAMRPRLIAFFTAPPDATEIEFADGEGDGKKMVKQPREEMLKDIIRSMSPQVEFSEIAKGGTSPAKTDAETEFGKQIASSLKRS
jgi:hypothetical protein